MKGRLSCKSTYLFSYTEKGEIKDRYIFWNQTLDTIYSGKKTNMNYEYTDIMYVQDMESCVRSAATNAFKSKGIFSKSKTKIIF